MKNKGFTLIELLIVIALLGALAIGLLATVDPFEQLRKGRDTATRQTATEYYNAQLRYYGTKGSFTWNPAATTNLNRFLDNTNSTNDIKALINAGELKSNFIEAAGTNNLSKINAFSTPPFDNLTVCFLPESKNFRLDPNTIFDSTGGTSITGCGTGSSSTCYWCIK